MDPSVVALVIGPAGGFVFAIYVASKLWAAHEREDIARDALNATLVTSIDKLSDSVRDSTTILTDIREDRRREARAARAGK